MNSNSLQHENQSQWARDPSNVHHLHSHPPRYTPKSEPPLAIARTDEDIVLSIITSGRTSLAFQPIFKLAPDGLDIAKFESFTVWGGEGGHIVRPEAAFAIANRHGLTGQLIEELLIKTFRRCVDLPIDIKVSINLTQDQLLHDGLVFQILRASNMTGFDVGRVIFEVSEKITVCAIPKIRARLKELKMLGASIALDDFGTCAAGISVLSDLPLDIIKIDKSLLHSARDNVDQRQLLNGIAKLFDERFDNVIFEGVETKQDFDAVNSSRNGQLQGFYFGKILRLNNLGDYVQRREWLL